MCLWCFVCVILYANYDQCFPSLNWSTLFEHVLELEGREVGESGVGSVLAGRIASA